MTELFSRDEIRFIRNRLHDLNTIWTFCELNNVRVTNNQKMIKKLSKFLSNHPIEGDYILG